MAARFRPAAPTGIASFWLLDAFFGIKRSLRVDTVAGVLVDVEPSALLTNSSLSCKEVILEAEKAHLVLSNSNHYIKLHEGK